MASKSGVFVNKLKTVLKMKEEWQLKTSEMVKE